MADLEPDNRSAHMTDHERAIFDKQVNMIVRIALASSDVRPVTTKRVAYATLMLIGAVVKLAMCGGYTGGPADLAKTLTRMWDATKYIGKSTNSAGGDA